MGETNITSLASLFLNGRLCRMQKRDRRARRTGGGGQQIRPGYEPPEPGTGIRKAQGNGPLAQGRCHLGRRGGAEERRQAAKVTKYIGLMQRIAGYKKSDDNLRF